MRFWAFSMALYKFKAPNSFFYNVYNFSRKLFTFESLMIIMTQLKKYENVVMIVFLVHHSCLRRFLSPASNSHLWVWNLEVLFLFLNNSSPGCVNIAIQNRCNHCDIDQKKQQSCTPYPEKGVHSFKLQIICWHQPNSLKIWTRQDFRL